MGKDRLEGIKDHYDVIVIGSGLAGLTSANVLAQAGHSVLLLEHHYQYGGLSTWFKRKGGHIFDVSLHGFPVGMIKSCRKYWSRDIADRIHQIQEVRFENPQFSIGTTFDRTDFSRILVEKFKIEASVVEDFFTTLRKMNYYEDSGETTGELFERFFPGRNDVTRFLLEPIAYANGSTLQDPAITYGIVFSNFMSKGVYIFKIRSRWCSENCTVAGRGTPCIFWCKLRMNICRNRIWRTVAHLIVGVVYISLTILQTPRCETPLA